MSEKTTDATYSDTLEFQNDWGTEIVGVWVAYTSGSQDTVYFDKPSQSIGDGDTIKIGSFSPRSGHSDYWTVTFLKAAGELWGSKVQFKCNVPNDDETVQIEAEGTSQEIQIISSKGTTLKTATRL